MTNISFSCPTPGCAYSTEELEAVVAIKLLEPYVSQVHGTQSKPEKPKRPCLQMAGSVIDQISWEAFKDQFENYKTLAGCSDFPIFYEGAYGKSNDLGRVLLQLLKIAVTSRLDQLVLLNIYYTLSSNTTNLAILCTIGTSLS